MAKEKFTFRLSRAALKVIENRDRESYPTATEFVEQSVINFEKSEKLDQLIKMLQRLDANDQEILKFVRSDNQDIVYPNL